MEGSGTAVSSSSRKRGSKNCLVDDPRFKEIAVAESWYAEDPALIDKLVRLTRELISERPNLIRNVCEALVRALSTGSQDASGALLHIGGLQFASREELGKYCRTIMKQSEIGAPLEAKEYAFMREVLLHHPRGKEKLHRCDAITVGYHPQRQSLKCFYIVRKDGREDFSFLRCTQNAPTREVRAQERLCTVLCEVLNLHPGSSMDVAQLLSERFPKGVKVTVERQRNWSESILRLCTRMPALSEFLLRVLVRHMLELDAEIARFEGDLPDHDDAHGAGESQPGSPLVTAEGSDSQEAGEIQKKVNKLADGLDAMMVAFFEFLQRHIQIGEDVDLASGSAENRLVGALLIIFEQLVLVTHQVRHVQFLWFYLASLRPAWMEAFLTLLLQCAYSGNQAMIKRYLALAYAASFVARSNSLKTMFALQTAQYIAGFAREHMQEAEVHVARGELDHPQLLLYLSAVQAVCYVLCFFAKDFAESTGAEFAELAGSCALDTLLPEPGSAVMAQNSLTPVLMSTSRPLVRINHHVAGQFCRSIRPYRPSMAHSFQNGLAQFKAEACKGQYQGDAEGMDVFFPFDPYRLRHSSMFLLCLYRNWESPEDEDAEIEEDEDNGFRHQVTVQVTKPPRTGSSNSIEDSSDEAGSNADFAEMADAAERGFIPSVRPSPAFRPMPDAMHLASPALDQLSPACVPMDTEGDDDSLILPPASVDACGSDVLQQLLGSAAYMQGRR